MHSTHTRSGHSTWTMTVEGGVYEGARGNKQRPGDKLRITHPLCTVMPPTLIQGAIP